MMEAPPQRGVFYWNGSARIKDSDFAAGCSHEMSRPHTATFLSHSAPPNQQGIERTLEVARQITEALKSGSVHALNFAKDRSAPPGHPDAFPNGDGVRKDKRQVLMVVIEVDDPAYATD